MCLSNAECQLCQWTKVPNTGGKKGCALKSAAGESSVQPGVVVYKLRKADRPNSKVCLTSTVSGLVVWCCNTCLVVLLTTIVATDTSLPIFSVNGLLATTYALSPWLLQPCISCSFRLFCTSITMRTCLFDDPGCLVSEQITLVVSSTLRLYSQSRTIIPCDGSLLFASDQTSNKSITHIHSSRHKPTIRCRLWGAALPGVNQPAARVTFAYGFCMQIDSSSFKIAVYRWELLGWASVVLHQGIVVSMCVYNIYIYTYIYIYIHTYIPIQINMFVTMNLTDI